MSHTVIIRPDENGNHPFMQIAGNILQEQQNQTNAVGGVLTFSETLKTVEIYNTDATNTGTFTINGINIVVPPNKSFKSDIGGVPSAQVTIAGATTYTVSRYI